MVQRNRRGLLAPLPAARKPGTASVFVSKKTGRLYVRLSNQPLFDVPVEIRDPDRPIGTHVFTALDVDKDAKNMRWSVVTMPGDVAPRAEVQTHRGRKSRFEREPEVPQQRASASAGDAATNPNARANGTRSIARKCSHSGLTSIASGRLVTA